MKNSLIESFAAKHPNSSRQITNLGRMEDAISAYCFEPFFEPVCVLDDLFGAAPKLFGPMGNHLNAWTRHIGYGTIGRLRQLSEPAIEYLLRDELGVYSGPQNSDQAIR